MTTTRRTLVAAALVAAATSTMACNRWVKHKPQRLHFASPDAAFEAAQVTLQRRGYAIDQLDPIHYYIRVPAKLDQPGERLSWLELQVYSDGQMSIRAHGFHVRDGDEKAHRKLASEMKRLADALKQSGGQAYVAHR